MASVDNPAPEMILRVSNASKAFPIAAGALGRLRLLLPRSWQRDEERFWALRDVSFELPRGQSLGVVGANGSGKSTLLQIVAGILRPTDGRVETHGRIAGLLELGSGFNPEFTGRENVRLSTALHGLNGEQTAARFDEITRFADIGDFLDQPVKTYSSGMLMRLAFAVSIHVDADILLVDEALAVGDIAFRQRCMRRVHEMRARGLSILFVSHAAEDVKAICDRCMWLEEGRVRALGETDEVVAQYLANMAERDAAQLAGEWREQGGREPYTAEELAPACDFPGHRFGDRRAEISGAEFLNTNGAEAGYRAGETVSVRYSVRAHQSLAMPIVGFLVRDRQGLSLFSTNSTREGVQMPPLVAGDHVTVDFNWTLPRLARGEYGVTLGISDGTLERFAVCDYVEDALRFTVCDEDAPEYGWLGLECTVSAKTVEAAPSTDAAS
jgi:ABC-type polysaccharide/polyol phosphate transport system ATPase subunit